METQQIPQSAFRFEATVQKFAKSETKNEASIEILARSSKPIEHWYWGNIVHDIDGFRSKPKIALDYCHDTNQVIGFADQFSKTKEGLTLAGKLVSVEDGDRASVVMAQGEAGIPFEGSIFFDEAVLEWIPEDVTTEVNGFQFAGPGVVVREWFLRGCAVCPYGADSNTDSSFADSSANHFSWKGRPMPRKKKGAEELTAAHDTNLEDTVELEVETEAESVETETTTETSEEANSEGGDQSTSSDSTELSSDPRTELKRYMNRFGDIEGAKYFADGLSWSDSQDRFIQKLCADRDSATKRAEDAEAKLSALAASHGEETGVRTGALSRKAKTVVKSISEARELAAKA